MRLAIGRISDGELEFAEKICRFSRDIYRELTLVVPLMDNNSDMKTKMDTMLQSVLKIENGMALLVSSTKVVCNIMSFNYRIFITRLEPYNKNIWTLSGSYFFGKFSWVDMRGQGFEPHSPGWGGDFITSHDEGISLPVMICLEKKAKISGLFLSFSWEVVEWIDAVFSL